MERIEFKVCQRGSALDFVLSITNRKARFLSSPLIIDSLIIFNRSRINCVRLPLYESLLRYGQCKYPVLYPYFKKTPSLFIEFD